MERDKILKWLNSNRNYYKGIALLQELKPTLAKKFQTNIVQKELLYETMKSLLPEKEEPKPQQRQKVVIPVVEKPRVPTNPIAEEQKKKADKLYKEMSNKRAVLFKLCPDKETKFENEGKLVSERGILCQEIMELQYKVDEAYDAFQFANQHNRLPESITKPIVDAKELYKKISNARKYISKYTLRLNKLSAEEMARLDAKKQELSYLESLYNND